jgi:tRNA threonylcarbamoyladenosine biosynthesis protein TsaB
MKLLALELSSPVGSIAYCGGKQGLDFRAFPADRKDSGFFYENLSAVYENDGPPDLIVVGLGPGSYAGVRIAIATALGLRSAARSRLRGLPSICAIERTEYLFIGDARRNSFVFAHIADGRCIEGPLLAAEEEIHVRLRSAPDQPAIATQPLVQFDQIIVEQPSALRLAQLALRGDGADGETLEPIYLRAPYVTSPTA